MSIYASIRLLVMMGHMLERQIGRDFLRLENYLRDRNVIWENGMVVVGSLSVQERSKTVSPYSSSPTTVRRLCPDMP